MKRNKIMNFISKYNLSGNVDSVRWNFEDNKLKTTFLSPTKALRGSVITDFEYNESAEIGIYETVKLSKMISIMEDEIEMKLNKSQDKFRLIEYSDSSTKIKYMLSELDIIEKVGDMKYIPTFDVDIKLTKDIITKFLKARNAIDLSEYFYINCDILSDTCKLILGEGVNQIILDVEYNEISDMQHLSFSTELFSEILNANKDFESVIFKISNEGLMYLNFTNEEFKCDYYLVAKMGNEDE